MSYYSGVRMRLWSSEKDQKSDLDHLSPSDSVLICRLEDGYSFVTTSNTQKNVEISKKYKLGYIWNWLQSNENFEGVGPLLEESKSSIKSKWNYTFYTSQSRNNCLAILGWPECDRYKPSKDRCTISPLQSALISLCNFDQQSALEALKEVKTQERVLYSVLKAFTFDNSKSSVHKIAGQLSYSAHLQSSGSQIGSLDSGLGSLYASAIFLFMAGPAEYSKIFEKLPFPDNLAFACLFFSDQQLRKSYKKLLEEYRKAADLNGVVISGFDSIGIEIMDRYYELTEDIQTVALVAMTAKALSINKFAEWILAYKEKLNSLELWYYRAKLEIDERRVYRINQESYKTSKCSTCGALLAFCSKETDGWNEKDFGKKFISICDNCPGNNNNLCCSVCLMPYLSVGLPQFELERSGTEDWFVWCESCNHAGHAEHLALWFQEYNTCPVVGCKCKCEQILFN